MKEVFSLTSEQKNIITSMRGEGYGYAGSEIGIFMLSMNARVPMMRHISYSPSQKMILQTIRSMLSIRIR